MFESLSDKLKRTLKNLRGEGVLTKEHVDAALREIRLALLEADVNYKVAKDFIAAVKEKAEGQQVWQELKPSEQVVKIVFDELVQLLGGQSSRLVFTRQIPNVVMIVGLQGSGKTTSTGKIARWLATFHGRKSVHDQRGWDALIAIGYSIQQPRPRHPAAATLTDRAKLKKSSSAPQPMSARSTRARSSRSGRRTSIASA